MTPSEDQIRELMKTVACVVCGVNYRPASVEVLGHRDELWFLRVSCSGCSTSGLVAALVKPAEGTEARSESAPPAETAAETAHLDSARAPGPVRRSDVAGMRNFLEGFDGDFATLFGPDADARPQRPAA